MRDLDGRTYAAASVRLDSMSIDALPLAVAMAVSSGAKGLEAGAVVTGRPRDAVVDVSAIRDLGGRGIPVWVTDPSGGVNTVQQS